jgi:hypothetical protein
MIGNLLVGTWRLLSFEVRSDENDVSYPLGRDAIGYLSYTANGYMSMTMMKPKRPQFLSEDPSKGSLEEKGAAFDTYMTYCGTYILQENRVIHHLELCLFPNWIESDFERIIDVTEDRLSLRTLPQLVFGRWQTGHLIWVRA